MAVCRIYDVAGATLEQYDEVDSKLGPEKPDGALFHVAGMLEGRLQVIEVWESSEHLEAYEKQLGPALEDANVPDPLVSEFEVHKMDWVK